MTGGLMRGFTRFRFWFSYHYFRAVRHAIRLLMRLAFWRAKPAEEWDYQHAGSSLLKDRISVRSEKADGKRRALAYARTRTGNAGLSWRAARRLMGRWEREERAVNAGGSITGTS